MNSMEKVNRDNCASECRIFTVAILPWVCMQHAGLVTLGNLKYTCAEESLSTWNLVDSKQLAPQSTNSITFTRHPQESPTSATPHLQLRSMWVNAPPLVEGLQTQTHSVLFLEVHPDLWTRSDSRKASFLYFLQAIVNEGGRGQGVTGGDYYHSWCNLRARKKKIIPMEEVWHIMYKNIVSYGRRAKVAQNYHGANTKYSNTGAVVYMPRTQHCTIFKLTFLLCPGYFQRVLTDPWLSCTYFHSCLFPYISPLEARQLQQPEKIGLLLQYRAS